MEQIALIMNNTLSRLYCIHTKKLSCLKSGAESDMNDILYEFKNLHHFYDSLTFGVKAVLPADTLPCCNGN